MRGSLALIGLAVTGCNQVLGLDPVATRDGGTSGDGGLAHVDEVVAGGRHTCARVGTRVWCWGRAKEGQLGRGNSIAIGDDEAPAAAGPLDLGGDVQALAAGGDHACALRGDGGVVCWGAGGHGALGYGNTDAIGDTELPSTQGAVGLGVPARRIAAGADHTCAVTTGSAVVCWGAGADGRLGYANVNDVGDNEAVNVAGTVQGLGTVSEVAAGGAHTCTVDLGGAVRCWGRNDHGQLGLGNTVPIGDDESPGTAVPLAMAATQVVTGDAHTCALLSDQSVRCWGAGGDGRLGYASVADEGDDGTVAALGPVMVGGPVRQLAAGAAHTCALLTTGAVRCWGAAARGQLGRGSPDAIGDNEVPAAAGDLPLPGPVAAITAGGDHTCALLTDATIRCWGANESGQLGTGDVEDLGDDEPLGTLPPVGL